MIREELDQELSQDDYDEFNVPEFTDEELPVRTIKLKGKPCVNFQTIEFELDCVIGDYDTFFAVYDSLFDYLTKYQTASNVPSEPLATEKQLNVIKSLKLKVNEKTLTQREAYNLIKEHCGK